MLILTYHQICPEEARGAREFYTVDVAQVRMHLDLLYAHGAEPGSVDALLSSGAGPRDFLLTFDDGTADHWEVAHPFLQAHGLRGVFFVPTEKIDRPGYLTAGRVRALAVAGHEIGCHSHAHRRLDTMSETEIRNQLTTSIDQLRALTGVSPRIFATPGGYTDARVRRIATSLGLGAQRTMEWGLNRPLRLDALQCVPFNRRLSPARFGKILDGRGLGWLKSAYLGKRLLRSLLPMPVYARLRDQLLRPPST